VACPPHSLLPRRARDELLERAYRHTLQHGVVDLSLRPLAAAVGSSPRVLLYLFGSKDDLAGALLARARQDELALLAAASYDSSGPDLPGAGRPWQWLADPDHSDLLRLWVEAYARSLVDPTGPWTGFAAQTVQDWLNVLAEHQPEPERTSADGAARRTQLLALLRGALLDPLRASTICARSTPTAPVWSTSWSRTTRRRSARC
jgi:AcrR family transcriptional regulator